MRYLFIALFIFLMPLAAQAQEKHGDLPYLFTPDGEARSPFADFDANEKTGDPLSDLYDPIGQTIENSSTLDTPHRSVGQLGLHAADLVARSLNMNEGNANTVWLNLRDVFTENGWQQYQRFLDEEGILAGLRNGRYSLASFRTKSAELLGQGVQNETYKWAYDVPITTVHGSGHVNDRNRNNDRLIKDQLNIVVQLTRIDPTNAKVEHDVKIEGWTVQRLNRFNRDTTLPRR